MSAAARTSRSSLRGLRGAAAVVVAAGYLAALNATAVGHGWRLLPHLALEHGPAVVAPGVVEDADLEDGTGVVLTTLRRVHRHGGHAHTHGPAPADLESGPASRTHAHSAPTSRPTQTGTDDLEGDLHEHDGVVHSHETPPGPAALLTVSLDKHQRPTTTLVAAFSAPRLSDLEDDAESFDSVEHAVETPPPVRRG